MKDLALIYNTLKSVYTDEAYAGIALNTVLSEAENPALVTKTVYGVLEYDVRFEYYLTQCASKRPKTAARLVIKIGFFLLMFTDIPRYAVINESVELIKSLGKRENVGFVNAILQQFAPESHALPQDALFALSVRTSKPMWLVKKLCKQYGRDKAEQILSIRPFHLEHVRPNRRLNDTARLKQIFEKEKIDYKESPVGGLFCEFSDRVRKLQANGLLTVQSVCSMRASEAVAASLPAAILDICAAPGGKAVYLSELLPASKITAAELHEHRLRLIESYRMRMGARNITVVQNDASIMNKGWTERFDCVLADVPCSGFGVMHKKPDILIRRKESDLAALTKLQAEILRSAFDAVKPGGYLIYSTCTVLAEENDRIIDRFLKETPRAQLAPNAACGLETGRKQYLPDGEGLDGFYIARMKKS